MILLGSANLFMALKLAGAAYLMYLAWQCFRNVYLSSNILSSNMLSSETNVPQTESSSVSALTAYGAFRQGLLSNVLNPKPIIFYMAFLPQFINPESFRITTILIYGVLTFFNSYVLARLVSRNGTQSKKVVG